MKMELIDKFKEVFKKDCDKVFFAPGRVNLIGEHTDYNGGFVFPCGLNIGTYGVVRLRDDRKVCLYSKNFEEDQVVTRSLDTLERIGSWTDYLIGEIKTFIDHGYRIDRGFDLLVYGNIPNGAGLSSSASLEVLTGTILRTLYNLDLDMVDIVKMSQENENKFIGVSCGIMDQFASGMAKKNKAILLDCNTLKYEYIPLELNGYRILIGDTKKQRGLADSAYNQRRQECEKALAKLQKITSIKALGELSVEEFEKIKEVIKDKVEEKRAKHAIYENQRTKDGKRALEEGNLEEFGRLMKESHISLRDDYEVTGIHLDTMVEALWEEPGVIGARMTGAGFGGCTVSIVKEEYIGKIIENVRKKYKEKTGLDPEFYNVKIDAGAREI